MGLISTDWKTCNISPISIKGLERTLETRPVSLRSVVCKLIESIITDDMVIFWRKVDC